MKRKLIITANWKKNHGPKKTKAFFKKLKKIFGKRGIPKSVDVVIGAPDISITTAYKHCPDSIFLAAQNCSDFKGEADTGGISPEMFGAINCDYIFAGHSELRQRSHETDKVVNTKTTAILDAEVYPMVCIGETLGERRSGRLKDVLRSQVGEALKGISEDDMYNVVIAYEPVWAIGTGVVATPKEAQETHAFIRSVIADLYGEGIAEIVPILYGGSMNENNAKELISQPDIDGGLIGGASLDPKSFGKIIKIAAKLSKPKKVKLQAKATSNKKS